MLNPTFRLACRSQASSPMVMSKASGAGAALGEPHFRKRFDAAPRRGAKFHFTLGPEDAALSDGLDETRTRRDPCETDEDHEVLVEDSDDAELTFSEARVVHRLVRVANGKESINWLHARGRHEGRGSDELPALVLLDFKLRGMSGLEVLAEIRRHETTKRLPVAVSTTSVEEPS